MRSQRMGLGGKISWKGPPSPRQRSNARGVTRVPGLLGLIHPRRFQRFRRHESPGERPIRGPPSEDRRDYATNVSYSLSPRAAFWSFLGSG